MSPTNELYAPLIAAYKYFNEHLFSGELPEVIFTLQRKKDVMGFFAAKRWGNVDGNICNEISINPSYFANSRMIEVLQTLVHEMVHCWQYSFGSPSRPNYHNKEWAMKMISVGLMPSTTGEPGGAIVGQAMGDFIIKEGKFMSCVTELLGEDNFQLPWVDRYSLPKLFDPVIAECDESLNPTTTKPEQLASPNSFSNLTPLSELDDEQGSLNDQPAIEVLPEAFFVQEAAKKQTRSKYICPICDTKIYGKMRLNIVCGDCNSKFVESN